MLGVIACSAAAMSVIAETQTTSGSVYPVCTAPCECISESEAAARWGAEGYEMCSKSICGQTDDAMIQFYCIHRKGGAAAPAAVTTTVMETTLQQTMPAPATSAAPLAVTPPAGTTPAPIETKKSPVGAVVIPAVIGAVVLAAARAQKP
jgi:hypothetical protein